MPADDPDDLLRLEVHGAQMVGAMEAAAEAAGFETSDADPVGSVAARLATS